jgi:hypothetical protein
MQVVPDDERSASLQSLGVTTGLQTIAFWLCQPGFFGTKNWPAGNNEDSKTP